MLASLSRLAAVTAVLLTLLVAAPGHADTAATFTNDFAGAIETAHGAEAWHRHTAFETEIIVQFGGNTVVQGTLLFETSSGKARLTLDDGTVLVYDGAEVWTTPADSTVERGRFHALTWPYFLAAPFKLRDPGSALADLGPTAFRGAETQPAARLTFEGAGDTPDDWYVVYRDGSNRLSGMAYIVTFGKDQAAAEAAPHAIVYGGFEQVDGVTIPTRWQFFNWSKALGVHGDAIGSATLTAPRFVTPDDSAFTKPAGARREPLPSAG